MAAPVQTSPRSDIPNPDNPFLPDDILDHMILPRLPFKTLKRFQCVSKKYRSLIGHDPLFPSEQARLLSPSYAYLVHLSRDGRLSALINPERIGVPDPSLQFLGSSSDSDLQLLCSTNGLLLFCGYFEDSEAKLCLCNPATQEKQFVPSDGLMLAYLHDVHNTGLAFDPSVTPNRYLLVRPYPETKAGGGYSLDIIRFDIFQSDTGKWRSSNKRVHVRGEECVISLKRVYIQGVIYWHFPKYVMWYDTEKDLPGCVPLPTTGEYWCMGVYAHGVVCCHTSETGVEVWRLTNGTRWDRVHCISWDSMPLQINHTMFKVFGYKGHITLYKSRFFRPLSFDGQFVYLLDFQSNWRVNTEMGRSTAMLGYNVFTQQLEKKGEISIEIFEYDGQAYDYHNSMARLPRILG